MQPYTEVELECQNKEQKEIIIALLAEMNFEGFEEEVDLLKAYIPRELYNEKDLKVLAHTYHLNFSANQVENRNWNTLWESNFNPVIINHPATDNPWVAIRADFHAPIRNTDQEIIITPKMSFGTGHHATTEMMIRAMGYLDFKGKTVLDFGTGTGILAILAEKFGASKIIAIDIDDQSIRNADENFSLNNCTRIQLIQSSSAEGEQRVDIILANIIKTVIKKNLDAFVKRLEPGGILVASGLLKDEESEMLELAGNMGLFLEDKIQIQDWICLKMKYNPKVF